MEENKKPFLLELDEAKNEIIQVVNKALHTHNLSCYLVDLILSEIGSQVKEGAKQEILMAKVQMQSTEQPQE